MCGMYYVDSDLEEDIERFLRMRGEDKNLEIGQASFAARDVHPTDLAPVLVKTDGKLQMKNIKWGLQGFQKGQVIFNARSETAMDKQVFRQGIAHGRIVIPAVRFYEWNKRKEKNTFRRMDGRPLFMAGFSVGNGMDERFTILTTAANESMLPVHDRMPLVLEESEVIPWLYDQEKTAQLLEKTPSLLSRSTDYEQLSLF